MDADTTDDLTCPAPGCTCTFPPHRLAGLVAHVERAHPGSGDVRVVDGVAVLVGDGGLGPMTVPILLDPGASWDVVGGRHVVARATGRFGPQKRRRA